MSIQRLCDCELRIISAILHGHGMLFVAAGTTNNYVPFYWCIVWPIVIVCAAIIIAIIIIISSSYFCNNRKSWSAWARAVERWRCVNCWILASVDVGMRMPVEVEFLAPTTHIYAIIMSLGTFVDFWFWRVRQRSFQSFATHSNPMRRCCKRMLCNFNLNNFWIASKQPQSIIFLGTNAAVLPHSGTQTHNWHIFGMLCTHSCRARCSKVII